MALSTDFTAQFGMLPKSAQEAIFADMTANDNPLPTMNMNVNGRAVTGPVFKGDAGKTDVTVGPLTAADLGAPQAVQRPQQQPGALSMAPMPRREPVDIASMLERFVPQDDSQAKYLALAAGFGSATKTGSFSEQIGNVASAMNEQKMQQAKLRSQYAPLIMQQVAAQQAREEQNIYRLEAQREAQAAAQAAAQQAQQARADQQAETIRAANERAAADRALRSEIAGNKPEPAPHFTTAADGTQYTVDRSGQARPVLDPSGKPLQAKSPMATMSASMQKELLESDDAVQSSKVVANLLNQALLLNNKAYSGYGAKGRALVRSNLPGASEEADATINLDNIMTGQALESLRATFGGAPTEGERKILLDIQASAEKTPEQRKLLMERAIAAAQTRGAYAAQKAKAIRDGSYLTEGMGEVPPPDGSAGSTPAMPTAEQLAAELARRKKGS